ncbi:dolichyl-phosphate beta-glucosyltransferase-like [Centruroides sculpturatus]|uniref:dolichyl-phosphate beta-glucosyltransferase-like n=1 Tax=Centruroides sculpturatus TaxID=218467 RepID=UPI000C6EF757|nr:dolichyl-phosphate beta-glucosyltransferase-like [Centruroides sculpturatus]
MAPDLMTLMLMSSAILLIIFVILCITLHLTSIPIPIIQRYEAEKYYVDPSEPNEKYRFPDLNDPPTLELSVVVPAYNEEKRLIPMLEECLGYLEKRNKQNSNFTYEVIIVDDGSKDKTSNVALEYARKCGINKLRVLTLTKNRGKGGAVRLGMMSTRGKFLLFADADGATKFNDIEKLEESMKDFGDKTDKIIAIGSRAHLEKESIAKRSVFRTFLMYGFHFLVWLFGVKGVRDTQCGFKMLTREAAQILFPALHVERWAFDVELLHLAREMKIPISEVAVNWTEIEGSKLVPVLSWLQMGIDLILIWLKYRIGAWKVKNLSKH